MTAIPGVWAVETRVTGNAVLDLPGRDKAAVGKLISLPVAGTSRDAAAVGRQVERQDGPVGLGHLDGFAAGDIDPRQRSVEPAEDKIYRHPTFYEIPEGVENL